MLGDYEVLSMKYKLLSSEDEKLLKVSEESVFDCDVQLELGTKFMSDPRHNIAVAIEDSTIVGIASAVNYIQDIIS